MNFTKSVESAVNAQQLVTSMVNTIQNPDLFEFVNFVLREDTTIMETFKKSASSGGKYHPVVSNGDWGLLNHTALALLAFDTFESFYTPQNKLTPIDCDICRIAIIFHDAWKYESLSGAINPSYTTKDHGAVAAVKLNKLREKFITYKILDGSVVVALQMIIPCVRYHMSNWCHNAAETNYAQNNTGLKERIVMICDFIASNKGLASYTKRL